MTTFIIFSGCMAGLCCEAARKAAHGCQVHTEAVQRHAGAAQLHAASHCSCGGTAHVARAHAAAGICAGCTADHRAAGAFPPCELLSIFFPGRNSHPCFESFHVLPMIATQTACKLIVLSCRSQPDLRVRSYRI